MLASRRFRCRLRGCCLQCHPSRSMHCIAPGRRTTRMKTTMTTMCHRSVRHPRRRVRRVLWPPGLFARVGGGAQGEVRAPHLHATFIRRSAARPPQLLCGKCGMVRLLLLAASHPSFDVVLSTILVCSASPCATCFECNQLRCHGHEPRKSATHTPRADTSLPHAHTPLGTAG